MGLSVAVLLASAMVLSLAPAMLTLLGRGRLVAAGLAGQAAAARRHRGAARAAAHPSTARRPQPQAGRVVPGTAAWPKPSIPIRETTPPADGNGRVDHVPDD